MNKSKRLIGPLLAIAILAGCGRGLPTAVRRDISVESDNLETAQRRVKASEAALTSHLAETPDLFHGTPEEASWKGNISQAKADLQASETDARELGRLAERDRPDANISKLLADERRLRTDALRKAQLVDQGVGKWLEYRRDPAAFVAKIDHERDQIQRFNLTPVAEVVRKAEQDWPAKKAILESRLSSLTASTKVAESAKQSTPSTLIAEEDSLSQQAASLSGQSKQLQSECGQLYDSWDKILTDLDRTESGPDTLYRERIDTVRTHFVDVPLKKTETRKAEHWTDVSEASFHAVEDDIGMAIAHKDAGQFDSEAQNTPQPPGFSYVASPSVGSNQYGYWTHNGGQSVWTFLPEYLILRELLWNHDYRPVMATEYNAYRAAQSRGTTYYGRETPSAAPKYGTHGTFTQSHYAESRYVQSGGFKGSAYASGGAASSGSSWLGKLHPTPQSGPTADSLSGKRFGRQPSSTPLGQRFGRTPSPRPSGRSFGRRR